MNRTIRNGARFATALLFVSLLVGIASPSASAALPSCWADGCWGKNPALYVCGDDPTQITTLSTYQDEFGHKLELRWSRACRSAWVRWRYTDGPVRIVPSVWVPGGTSVGFIDATADGKYWWTGMVDGREGIEDCYGAHIYNRDGSYNRWQFMGCVA
ncbi:DUF2690 domain-containing protein [Planosporangium sp. 12N6]|uniref:DUF2690 domain-containing protein n=1 Tax=Planosporangium spinosum TaxID=3402278 RepID=UPI003CF03DEC